jgi:hypothetical protein
LWTVSASRAADPVNSTTVSCAIAVASSTTRLIFSARIPAVLPSRAGSIESAASWLCGRTSDRSRPITPSW